MNRQRPFSELPIELEGSHGQYIITREDNSDVHCSDMSIVYKVRDKVTQKLLALKTLWRFHEPSEKERSYWQKAVRQFDREINTLESLQGIEGIIQVRDRGIYEGLSWYVMDYIEGTDIITGLHDKPLQEKIRALRQFVQALSHAHQKGIVHRDLKPSNILLDQNQKPVILDFGICKVAEQVWGPMGKNSDLWGTPRYMAYEQLAGTLIDQETMHQVDIWAVGVLFYEVLVEEHPFGIRNGDAYKEMVDKILHQDMRDLSSFGKPVDRSIAEICYKALSKDTVYRYKNAAEMLQDLNQWESYNFNKHIMLARELIHYKDWQEAAKRALDAHVWRPCDPQVKECLTAALSGEYKIPLTISWIDITENLYSFRDKCLTETFPQNIAKIYDIHDQQPYFVVVSAASGIPLPQLLLQRNETRGHALLELPEVLRLLKAIEEAICYFTAKNLPLYGLENQYIYCILGPHREVEKFVFWGLGWRGELTQDPIKAVVNIIQTTMADAAIALAPEVEEMLTKYNDIHQLQQNLENWYVEQQKVKKKRHETKRLPW